MKLSRRILALAVLPVLPFTTGCFGWTEATLEHYCGCSELRHAASVRAQRTMFEQLQERSGVRMEALENTLSRIDPQFAATVAPENEAIPLPHPRHDALDTALASIAVPTVFVVETAATIAAGALLIVLFPVVLYNWPKC